MNGNEEAAEAGSAQPSLSSFAKWKNEWRTQTLFFDVRDNYGLDNNRASNGPNIIDIPSTFCFSSTVGFNVLIAKAVWCTWTVATLIYAIVDALYKSYWLAFLSNWSLVFATFYLICSFVVSILPSDSSLLRTTTMSHPNEIIPNDDDNHKSHDERTNNNYEQPQQDQVERFDPQTTKISPLLKITWVSFAVASTFQCVTTILYWLLIYDSDTQITYLTLMLHGIVNIFVLVDGLLSNKIPVRMKHVLVVAVLSLCWVFWSVLHDLSSLSNPNLGDSSSEVGDSADDDAIYSTIRWNHEPLSAAILSFLVIFIVEPLLLSLIWLCSLRNRRYVQ